jgi:hypothetical protein
MGWVRINWPEYSESVEGDGALRSQRETIVAAASSVIRGSLHIRLYRPTDQDSQQLCQWRTFTRVRPAWYSHCDTSVPS